MLSDALDDGIITANPALGINRRGRKRADTITPADRQQKIRPMSHEELATFLSAANARCSRRMATLFLTLSDAGLRPGEACALQREDFDAVERTLRIARNIDNEGRVKLTKTAGTRHVDVSNRLAAALSALRASLEAHTITAGRHGVTRWIFATRAGTPVMPKRTGKLFKKILRAAGLEQFRLYNLRHTYATHLLGESAPLPYVSAQLGHSKPTTMLMYTRTGSLAETRASSTASRP